MRIKKELSDYIAYNIKELNNSGKTLGDIYRIMFRDNDLIIAEAEESYRVRKYSYTEIRDLIEKASFELNKRIGATHEYVALEMENCVEWIVAFWAVLRSGNKPFLVNCRHTTELSEGILKDLGIKTIIGMKSTKLTGEFIDFGEIYNLIREEKYKAGECPSEVFEDEIAISTSATSMHQSVCFYGGAQISQQILDAKRIVEENPRIATGYRGHIKQLAFLPFYHIFGLFAVFFWFGFFGRTFVFLKNYSPDTIAHACRRHEVTHIFAVPVLWHTVEKKIIKEVAKMPVRKQKLFYIALKFCTKLQNVFPYAGTNLAKYIMGEVVDSVFGQSIQFCISGGSYIMDSTLKLFNGIGYALHNGYGMSEVGITSVELRKRPYERNKNSVGRSFESIQYRIDEHGLLEIKGSSISKKVMIDGVVQERDEWFKTMDVAVKYGDYYFIRGRSKDIIIGENGENINPDVTEQFFDIPYAKNYACVGLIRNEGEVLTLVVQIPEKITIEQASEIYKKVTAKNDTLPNTARVRKFYFTYDPLMAHGAVKVSRPYLRKGIEEGSIRLTKMSDFVPQKIKFELKYDEEIMKQVKNIVSTTIDIAPEDIEPNANILVDLGATSLQYFEILSRITDMYGVETFSCNTVYELTKYIEGQKE